MEREALEGVWGWEWLDSISEGFSNPDDPRISGKWDEELRLEQSRSCSPQLMGNPQGWNPCLPTGIFPLPQGMRAAASPQPKPDARRRPNPKSIPKNPNESHFSPLTIHIVHLEEELELFRGIPAEQPVQGPQQLLPAQGAAAVGIEEREKPLGKEGLREKRECSRGAGNWECSHGAGNWECSRGAQN